ncbi:MAG: leucyl aminopeptidase [Bacteroidales bacterium]|nr:leucyl aminopeptidase [Bacteroidales bacterium]
MKSGKLSKEANIIYIAGKDYKFENLGFSKQQLQFVKGQIKEKSDLVLINEYNRIIILSIIDYNRKKDFEIRELCRNAANSALSVLKKHKIKSVTISHTKEKADELLAYAEGLALANYQFLKYLKKVEEKRSPLETIELAGNCNVLEIENLSNIIQAVYYCRNLVNEPLSYLNAVKLSEEIKNMGNESGYKVEILNKKQIEALKFGGLLAVNRGSIDPPTFSILEWKPENSKNKKPIILVGKGIVFDTGGLSLKPTPNSMDEMKSDMAGAAAVAGAMYAIAKNKIPVYVVGLIPATDNRPDGNAYVPGDIVKMHNGLTVEVLNTDAEGRMILADALSYAKRYKPQLVIDIATLTGSASMTVGKFATVAMGNVKPSIINKLKQCGENVYERIVELPFWNEYGELLKSDIADLKNIGGREAGAITGGKFLENFTSYPYIHLDIAGTAFLLSDDKYRLKGGTGVGVRLLHDFVKNFY